MIGVMYNSHRIVFSSDCFTSSRYSFKSLSEDREVQKIIFGDIDSECSSIITLKQTNIGAIQVVIIQPDIVGPGMNVHRFFGHGVYFSRNYDCNHYVTNNFLLNLI